MASCSDETIRLFDVKKGEELPSLKSHSEDVTSVVFSPIGCNIAIGHYNGNVRLWDVEEGKVREIISCQDEVTGLACSLDGQMVASATGDGIIKLWDVNSGEQTLNS